MRALLLALLAGCTTLNEATGGWGLDFGKGTVWQCEVEDASRDHAIVELELCWKRSGDELESSLWVAYGNEDGAGYATCHATERHSGPCWFHCGDGAGCNALDGCWCVP